jgi:hypothetical protein
VRSWSSRGWRFRRHQGRSLDQIGFVIMMPALSTRASIRPNARSVSSKSLATASDSDTSAPTAIARAGFHDLFGRKIKTMKRQAYGVRDLEFFKLKTLAIHEAKYAFGG